MTLTEALNRQAEADAYNGLLTQEELEALRMAEFDDTDYEAERYAESAWLRHAENSGWEEALLESYLESGFISRY